MAGPYSLSFYGENREGSRRSADVVTPLLIDLAQPSSVVDVGCGVGAWPAAFMRHGVADVLGIDGEHARRAGLEIPAEKFLTRELRAPLAAGRTFDLALSLEVAEHLEPEHADGFVAALTGLAPAVVFSAAVPGQTGQHHVNEQWPEYWVERFAARGYAVLDCLRPLLWKNPDVQYWYAQNMFLFAAAARLAEYRARAERLLAKAGESYARVHPRAWLSATDPRNYDGKRVLRAMPAILAAAVRARVRGARAGARRGGEGPDG